MTVDTLIRNVHIAPMTAEVTNGQEYGNTGAIALKNGLIHWMGSEHEANNIESSETIDGGGYWLTPGLIDCHTHLVYGGQRSREFELKLQGASYEQISREGGGIVSTVSETRKLSEAQLFEVSSQRLRCLLNEGVTTVEIKSGYGLDIQNEVKMLRVARMLGENHPVSVRTTFLGAHALPAEFSNKDAYIRFLIKEVLPEVHRLKLADAVDFFCEGIAFSRAQCESICQAAKSLGLPVKGHVEQLSNLRGASLVAEYAGLSVDHLEYLHEDDIPLIKKAGVTAVLLPGAFYFLGETHLPPVESLRKHQVPIAIASDLNPGSSPIASLLNVMNLACVQFKLSPLEALLGVTRHAAGALGLQDSIGQIKQGYDADLVLWPIESPAQLSYGMNLVKPERIFKAGKQVQAAQAC